MTITEIVKELNYKGRQFLVLKDGEGFYWGIESKYFVDGVLTKSFNGVSGFRFADMEGTERQVLAQIDIDEWKEQNPSFTNEELMQAVVKFVLAH